MCHITHTYRFCPCLNYACTAPKVEFGLQPDENLPGYTKKGHYLDERIERELCDAREVELIYNKWNPRGADQCEKVHEQLFDQQSSLCRHCKDNNCGRIVLDQQPGPKTTLARPAETVETVETKPKRSSTFSRVFRRTN